jgi:hypothetical protein
LLPHWLGGCARDSDRERVNPRTTPNDQRRGKKVVLQKNNHFLEFIIYFDFTPVKFFGWSRMHGQAVVVAESRPAGAAIEILGLLAVGKGRLIDVPQDTIGAFEIDDRTEIRNLNYLNDIASITGAGITSAVGLSLSLRIYRIGMNEHSGLQVLIFMLNGRMGSIFPEEDTGMLWDDQFLHLILPALLWSNLRIKKVHK